MTNLSFLWHPYLVRVPPFDATLRERFVYRSQKTPPIWHRDFPSLPSKLVQNARSLCLPPPCPIIWPPENTRETCNERRAMYVRTLFWVQVSRVSKPATDLKSHSISNPLHVSRVSYSSSPTPAVSVRTRTFLPFGPTNLTGSSTEITVPPQGGDRGVVPPSDAKRRVG